MARLYMDGFESHGATTAGGSPESGNGYSFSSSAGATFTADTTHFRPGGMSTVCAKVAYNSSGGNCENSGFLFDITAARTYYARVCYMFPSLPAGTRSIMAIWVSGTNGNGVSVKIDSSGNVGVYANGSTLVGSTTSVAANTWFVCEVAWQPNTTAGTDYIEMRVNGTSTGSTTTATTTNGLPTNNGTVFNYGLATVGTTAAGSEVVYVDDVAFNDSTTAANNSWCNTGSIGMLLPVSDNSVGSGWFAGDGATTTNLFNGIKNEPPVGVATGSGTTTSQIKTDAVASAETYVANLASYTTFGVPAGTTLVACLPTVIGGTGTAAACNAGVSATNPTVANVNNGFEQGGSTAVGTYPTGWANPFNYFNATRPVNGSTAVLGTQPTVTIAKAATAVEIDVCFVGMQFEAPPAVVQSSGPSSIPIWV